MKLKVVYFLSLLAALVLIKSTPGQADVVFESAVDRKSIAADEQLRYTLSLKGTLEKLPELPESEFSDFRVLSTSTATNISLQKGKLNKEISRTYILAPRSAGKFILPAMELKFKGKIYKTAAIEIEVTPGKKKPMPGGIFPTEKGIII